MTERQTLLNDIAATTTDYRADDREAPTSERIEQWIKQFDDRVQLPILRQLNHVLKKTYFSRKNVNQFLDGLLTTEKLVGADPRAFWKNIRFLDIQGGGNSQREMLAIFDKLLKKECGVEIAQCGETPTAYFYLDDAIFTGDRVGSDIEKWIKSDVPKDIKIYVATIALHRAGQHCAHERINAIAKEVEKNIDISWWRSITLEDRRYFTDTSDVLRPTAIPNDALVKKYIESMNHKPLLRTPGNVGNKELFSSDVGRQLLEQEFLKAGAIIRQQSPQIGDTLRPLGHMTSESLGFGSLIVTFRNCPNNAPLALWAGKPWIPLFPRTTNKETTLRRSMETLAKEGK